MSVPMPSLGHGGRLRRMWGLHVSLGHGGGVAAHWGPPVLSSMTSEQIQRSEKAGEASSDPRGHLWVTWGVCFNVPASRHWLISYSPIHLT